MANKGLMGLVVMGALSYNLIGCDKREDVVLKEGKIEECRVKVMQEVLPWKEDNYVIQVYDSKGKLRLNVGSYYLLQRGNYIQVDDEENLQLDFLIEKVK